MNEAAAFERIENVIDWAEIELVESDESDDPGKQFIEQARTELANARKLVYEIHGFMYGRGDEAAGTWAEVEAALAACRAETGKNQKDIRKFCPCARFNCGKYVIVPEVFIPTLEGTMTGRRGDWIIKGIKGEFYPCKPDIFAATYELEEPEKS